MKFILCLVISTLFGVNLVASADDDALTYYVQLIRGMDRDVPEDPKWKPIGERLSQRLSSVFRMKHYWEVNRQKVSVKRGKVTRTRLNKEREVEIELLDQDIVEIRLFRNGVLTRKTDGSKSTRIRILGGDKGVEEFWFVVVQRDEPQSPD